MSPEAWALLARRLDNEPPIIQGDELQRAGLWPPDRVVELGLLKETSPSGSAACWGCGQGYVGYVEFLTDLGTGQRRAYVPCRECGPVEIPLDSLRRWSVDLAGLIEAVAAVAGIRGPASEIVAGYLWRLGRARWAERPREVYFARQMDEEVRPRMAEVLAPQPKAVLLVPCERSRLMWSQGSGSPVFAIESVCRWSDGQLGFDREFVEAQILEGCLDTESRRKRRPRKRGERAAKIEQLEQELIQHLRAARDFAFTTAERASGAQLLPRPSQKDLAARTGLSEWDVSRCLNDPEARELRIYWQTALDLAAVMRWQGRRPR